MDVQTGLTGWRWLVLIVQRAVLALLFAVEVFGLFVRALMADNRQLRPRWSSLCLVSLISRGLWA